MNQPVRRVTTSPQSAKATGTMQHKVHPLRFSK